MSYRKEDFKQCNSDRLKWSLLFLLFICKQMIGLSPMREGKSRHVPGFQPFPSSGRAERDLQRGQEGLKCSWSHLLSLLLSTWTASATWVSWLSWWWWWRLVGSGLSVGAWLCFTIITSPVAQEIRRNSSGGCDYDGISQLCALRLLGCPGGKRQQSVTKGKVSQLGPLAKARTGSQGLDECSGLWEKLFQENVLLDAAYWDQAVSPHCLQENWGLFCSYHWWAKPIKEAWSVNYRCSSAACCFQVSFSNMLLPLWNKLTWSGMSVHLHTVLIPSWERTQRPLPKIHHHRQGGEMMSSLHIRKYRVHPKATQIIRSDTCRVQIRETRKKMNLPDHFLNICCNNSNVHLTITKYLLKTVEKLCWS